jgi:hypothetical protein
MAKKVQKPDFYVKILYPHTHRALFFFIEIMAAVCDGIDAIKEEERNEKNPSYRSFSSQSHKSFDKFKRISSFSFSV